MTNMPEAKLAREKREQIIQLENQILKLETLRDGLQSPSARNPKIEQNGKK